MPLRVRMSAPSEGSSSALAPDVLQRLLRLYLVLAYRTDGELHPLERQALVAVVRRWHPGVTEREAYALVEVAVMAARGASESPEALAAALAPALGPAERRRVLAELGALAKADGALTLREASVIGRVRRAWRQADAAARQPGSSRSR